MNHLVKSLLLTFLFLIPRESDAQEYSKVSFSIRGKWLYLPGWENVSWRSYSYGGEIFIGKHHAIGLDNEGFETHRRWEAGEYDDLVAMEVTKRTALYADYKYIQPFNEFFSLYGQVYSRFLGSRRYWLEKSAQEGAPEPPDPNALLTTHSGTFTDFGLGLGGKWYFNGGNSGLDLNVNVYKRTGSYKETVRTESGWAVSEVTDSPVSMYLKVSFFYHFLRFKRQE